MKRGIHPDYGSVVRDKSAHLTFLTRSTATSSQTARWTDGRDYPMVDVDISSTRHPFHAGKSRRIDTAGRVEKFERRYGTRPDKP